MVERIINKIVNEKIDIDKLLVLTFTNAAATEMRERILDSIYKKLDENPEDVNLKKQTVLLNKSNISTIHSFCLEIIKNYFYKIDVSPNFRLAEGAEIELLKMEIIEDVFEKLYDDQDENFLKLLNTYCSYRDDDALKNLVLKIYTFIQSTPFPEEWLEKQVEKYNTKNYKTFSDTRWCEIIQETAIEEIKVSINTLKNASILLKNENELLNYYLVILNDIQKLEEILNKDSWSKMQEKIINLSFEKWPVNKKIVSNNKEQAKQLRDMAKKNIENINSLFVFTEEEAMQDINEMYKLISALKELIIKFMNEFRKSKERKKCYRF